MGFILRSNRIPLNGVKYESNIIKFVFLFCVEDRLDGGAQNEARETDFLQEIWATEDVDGVGPWPGNGEQWIDMKV